MIPPPMVKILSIHTQGQGLHEFTAEAEAVVAAAGLKQDPCTLFIPHTSASLLIQESADPSARRDLDK